jgi:hypothetical protein
MNPADLVSRVEEPGRLPCLDRWPTVGPIALMRSHFARSPLPPVGLSVSLALLKPGASRNQHLRTGFDARILLDFISHARRVSHATGAVLKPL